MSSCGLAKGRLRAFAERLLKHKPGLKATLKSFQAALFVASAVHLMADSFEPLGMFTDVMLSVAGHLYGRLPEKAPNSGTSQTQTELGATALFKITPERFNGAYQGSEPLDRCQLAADLEPLLLLPDHTTPTSLKTVAVDLDLSPTFRRDHEKCQHLLDALLVNRDNSRRLLLIEPIAEYATSQVGDWLARMICAGVEFADGTLQQHLGSIRNYEVGEKQRLFGEVMGERIRGSQTDSTRTDTKHYPVLYRSLLGYAHNGQPISLEDARSPDIQREMQEGLRHAIVGSTYSPDDTFATPIGHQYGMQVHAAIAGAPREAEKHGWSLVLDIVFGVGLALVIRALWRSYFLDRTGLGSGEHAAVRKWPGLGRDLAYLYLVALAMLLSLMFLVALVLAVVAYMYFGWWIRPIGMAIGMALHAFVIESVETAEHLIQETAQPQAQVTGLRPTMPARPVGRANALRWLVAQIPCVVYVGVVGSALYTLRQH